MSCIEKMLMEVARPTEGLVEDKRNFAMKNLTSVIIALCTYFSFLAGASANNQCPEIGSPKATANNYMLFAAFQTGFDGYETPCELKCFGNEGCQEKCQSKEGLRLLGEKLQDILAQNNNEQCPSHTIGCLEQCEKLGVSCAAVCGQNKPVAEKSSSKKKTQL